MPPLTAIQPLIADALARVREDSQHHLAPVTRLAIYREIGLPTEPVPVRNPVRGMLGILTARRVLPIWQAATPIWKDEPADVPDDNILPDRMLGLAEGVWQGTVQVQRAWQEVNDAWYVVGNIGEEFSADRDDIPLTVYYSCDATMRALYETLGVEFLGREKELERYNDDDIPDQARDSASSAVIAFAGGADAGFVDLDKRLEFWEWWLKEAIPTVCE